MLTRNFKKSTIPKPNSILKNIKVSYQKLIFRFNIFKIIIFFLIAKWSGMKRMKNGLKLQFDFYEADI